MTKYNDHLKFDPDDHEVPARVEQRIRLVVDMDDFSPEGVVVEFEHNTRMIKGKCWIQIADIAGGSQGKNLRLPLEIAVSRWHGILLLEKPGNNPHLVRLTVSSDEFHKVWGRFKLNKENPSGQRLEVKGTGPVFVVDLSDDAIGVAFNIPEGTIA